MMKRFLSLILCLCLLGTASVALADGELDLTNAANVADANGNKLSANDSGKKTGNFDTNYSTDITVQVGDATENAYSDVYSVEIVWGEMAFTWGNKKTTTYTWNPETHSYTSTETKTENKDWHLVNGNPLTHEGAQEIGYTTQGSVMVFNHSNQPVTATISVDNTSDATNITNLDAQLTNSATSNSSTLSAATHQADANNLNKWKVYLADKVEISGSLTEDQETNWGDGNKVLAKLTVKIEKATANDNTRTALPESSSTEGGTDGGSST